MLDQSNKNVPTRKVKFISGIMQFTAKFKGKTKTERLRFTADLEQKLNRSFLMGQADKCLVHWDIVDAKLINSYVDSTDQFVY